MHFTGQRLNSKIILECLEEIGNRMKTKIYTIGCILTMCFFLAGCSQIENKIPDITDEQKDLIVEYATETLLSFDKKHCDKLGSAPEELKFAKPAVEGTHEDISEISEPTPPPEEIPSLDLTLPEDELQPEETEVVDNTENMEFSELEDALNINSEFNFTYEGYEIKESYPDSLDSYFVMSASRGNSLLIINFDVTNVTSDVLELNMPEKNLLVKIVLNGDSKNALTTLLLNDLTYYKEPIEPGASDKVVIVGEYSKEELETIESLALVLKKDDGSLRVNLE